jgi:hypothetical protein
MFQILGDRRREAVRRLVLGVVFIPLYVVVFYPAAFFTGIVLGAVDVGYILVTGEKPDYAGRLSVTIWMWTGGNIRYILSGEGDFELFPKPS